VRLNVEAVVALTHGLLPQLFARARGGIINVAPQMAFQPMPYFASYAASKAFVLSFSEALAEELRGTGMRVTAVAPGFVSTEFTEVAGSGEPERCFLRCTFQIERAPKSPALGLPAADCSARPGARSFVGDSTYGRSS
jgi:short-subunit dehydrogenase